MGITIQIDDTLIDEAMRETGLSTREATVEEALRRLILSEQRWRAIEAMAGLGWEGDLDAMRRGDGPET